MGIGDFMEKFNLVLSSSGFNDANNDISNEIVELFRKISKGKKILILANAAPEGTGNYIARERVKQNFLKIGALLVDVIDIDKDNTGMILNYDIIYGLGGDPTYLIDLVNNTNIKRYIVQFLENGIYIGESAGTMILSDDLEWAYIVKRGTKKKYDVILDTYKGLNLINYRIFPHYNKISEDIKEKAKNYENEYHMKFKFLNDGEFILEYYKW